MIKNNKGFTLVEVVAVVALLGILSVMVFPKIFSLVEDSRKKIYVQDATRLLAKAQYIMNAKSNTIEKPGRGEMIVLSMKYLSEGDFQNTPNDGRYLMDYSFVVIKNVDNVFYYAVTIIESTKTKDYRGVELTTEQKISANGAVSHVKIFDTGELVFVGDLGEDSIEDSKPLTADYIKGKLGSSDADVWGTDSTIVKTYINP